MKRRLIILLTAALLAGCATAEPESTAKSGYIPAGVKKPAEAATETLFFPMPPYPPKLQHLATISAQDNEGHRNIPLSGRLKLTRPHEIGAVKGKIYISERKYEKILILDLNEKTLSHVEGRYKAAGIWITSDDLKYTADFKNKQVLVFDQENKLIRTYTAPDHFERPTDVAVFEDRIYVCDVSKHQIFVLDRESGEVISEIGGIGTDEGMFYKPTHVIVDKDGNLYVNDFFNQRLQKLDPEGEPLKEFGYPGDTQGGFARPKGIGVDREGHLYAVDAAFENIQIFDDETTELLLYFGEFGMEPGNLYLPNGIYIDYENVEYFKEYADPNFKVEYLVYVGNTWGPVRLNVFGFGEWTGPPFEVPAEEAPETGSAEKNEKAE